MKTYNMALISAISAAMATPPNFYLMVSQEDAADLVADGLAVQNAEIKADAKIGKKTVATYATRLTDDGIAFNDANANNGQEGNATVTETATENTEKKVSKPRDIPVIEMLPVEELPVRVRQNNRQPLYPFAQLEIGGSFVVKKTEARPDPVRSLQTTISAANKRHAPKNFFITPVADGARIWRGQDVVITTAPPTTETPAA